MRILATDNGSPARSATAVAIIDIRRNFQAPTWNQQLYAVVIPETQSLGVPFQQVTASDLDSQVSIIHVFTWITRIQFNSLKICKVWKALNLRNSVFL